MTTNQMDVLAGIITNRYIHDEASYTEWIDAYELHRKRLSEYNEELSNEQRGMEDEHIE